MPIGIVLVEPRHPINVGYVARIMKNFGFSKLFLVDPIFDPEEARRFAMHGHGILETAIATDFQQLRRDSRLLIGTTALRSSRRLNVLRDAISAVHLVDIIDDLPKKDNIHVVLGREASGLTNYELRMCDIVVAIETGTEYSTMNISHALTIILYEITKRGLQNSNILVSVKSPRIACRSETDLLIAYATNAAELAGYDVHKRPLLDSAFKRLIAKSNPTSKEVMLMVSLFRKIILKMDRR